MLLYIAEPSGQPSGNNVGKTCPLTGSPSPESFQSFSLMSLSVAFSLCVMVRGGA